MADYELSFIHNGRERVAVIRGDDHRDAYEALQSLKQCCAIGDEIIETIPLAYEEKENDY